MKALVRWSLAVMLPVGRARASALSTPDGGHRFYSNEAAAAEPLQRIADFGPNPTGTKMYLYVPANVSTSPGAPAVVVALHYCGGTAQAYYTGTPYARLADQKGFLVVYPESPYEGTCWDVSSRAALTHNDDGSDTAAIAAMVTYAMDNYGADAKRVFVTGSSSGAMMTASLLSVAKSEIQP
ncbi:hypothetical protein VTK73DRAFT_9877 [Phialemonium thermophilum]|uniref:Carboxylic ester hydrolase n=1 Tax=Phialemonium thermophilum TaxID=223376 RepID=A0ABR3VZS4_9PEZI